MLIPLAKELFVKYGWTLYLCGTIIHTDKKTQTGEDIPFVKLSRGARDKLPRGWFREAVLQLRDNCGYIQCTSTWKDKKQVVMFLHTNTIGRTKDHTVRRHVPGQRERNVIQKLHMLSKLMSSS